MPFPESVQALIAARLDTLEPEAKSLLADAAVIGKVFWAGAVAAMGDRDPQAVTTTLRELSRKELVRPSRQSSMAGEAEYAFWHVLARDVAYNQLPRASRADPPCRCRRLDRVESTRAGRRPGRRARLPLRDRPRARPGSRTNRARPPSWKHPRCGSSAWPENAPSASTPPRPLASFERALTLTPERASRTGCGARPASARPPSTPDASTRRDDALEEAINAFQASGERRAAARAIGTLGLVLDRLGDPRAWDAARARRWRCWSHCHPAPSTSPRSPNSPRRGPAGQERGRDRLRRAGALARRAARPPAACPRARLPRPGPLQPGRPRRARRLPRGDHARHPGRAGPRGRAPAQQPRGSVLWPVEGPARRLEVCERASTSPRPAASPRWPRLSPPTRSTRWSRRASTSRHSHSPPSLPHRSRPAETCSTSPPRGPCKHVILTLAARPAQVADTLDWLETTTRESRQHRLHRRRSGPAAFARAALAQPDHAAALLAEIDAIPGSRETGITRPCCQRLSAPPSPAATPNSPINSRPASNPAPPTTNTPSPPPTPPSPKPTATWQAAADGYADAAQRWQTFGVVPEQAFALLGQGRCLVALGHMTEAAQPLRLARDIFQELQAAPALAETDALLRQATALSS